MKTDIVKCEKYTLSVDPAKNWVYYTMFGF
jgi:hypothetical protein